MCQNPTVSRTLTQKQNIVFEDNILATETIKPSPQEKKERRKKTFEPILLDHNIDIFVDLTVKPKEKYKTKLKAKFKIDDDVDDAFSGTPAETSK